MEKIKKKNTIHKPNDQNNHIKFINNKSNTKKVKEDPINYDLDESTIENKQLYTYTLKFSSFDFIQKFKKSSFLFKLLFIFYNLFYLLPLHTLCIYVFNNDLTLFSCLVFFIFTQLFVNITALFTTKTVSRFDLMIPILFFIATFCFDMFFFYKNTSFKIFTYLYQFFFFVLTNLISYSANTNKIRLLTLSVIIYVLSSIFCLSLIYDLTFNTLLFCISNIFILTKNLINFRFRDSYITNYEIFNCVSVGILLLNLEQLRMKRQILL